MSFLAPLFLAGAFAVSLPILFHLIRRSTREKTPFSSLMFLLPSPPRLTRRSRLEHLLLLLLRCLVLCLLALGFSRPFIKKALPPAPPSEGRRILILVDTSASMRRADLWFDARKKAESILRDTSPADQLALYTFDRQVTPLVSFDQWNATPIPERAALASGKLAEVSPGWSSTQLAHALITAAETLSENSVDRSSSTTRHPSSIILISDLQEGSHLDPLQGYEWPKGVTVSVETLKPRHLSNASLQLLTDSDDSDSKSNTGVRVRVSNTPSSKIEQFKVGWAAPEARSFAATPFDIYVPAGQSRILSLLSPTNSGQLSTNQSHLSSILLTGDEEDFDNTLFVIPPEPARLSVLYLGADSEKDPHQPLYFLQRAFQETRHQIVQVVHPSSPIYHPSSNDLLVATDPLPGDEASALHGEIAAGKTLLFAPKTEASAPTLSRLVGLDHLTLEEVKPLNYAMLGEIDFRHPLFAPFADPRFSDFTKIHFWKYRRLDASVIPGARVLAKFDNGDPALLEVPIGKGRVIILTSGWRPEDSQLALSSKFVPLLYSLLDLARPSAPAPVQFHVGDPIPQTQAQVNESNRTFPSPGIFQINSQPPQEVAVNLDPAESRTQPLPADQLEHLAVPVAYAQASTLKQQPNRVQLQNVDLENRQKLWRWFIVATLALVLFEIWFAGRTARRGLVTAES